MYIIINNCVCVYIYNIKNCMKKIKSTKQKEDIKKI